MRGSSVSSIVSLCLDLAGTAASRRSPNPIPRRVRIILLTMLRKQVFARRTSEIVRNGLLGLNLHFSPGLLAGCLLVYFLVSCGL
jgi:hypothetical protein